MARHRIHSLAFKKQVVQEYAAGATLNGLAREHDLSRNLIRIWIAKCESGEFDPDIEAATRVGSVVALNGIIVIGMFVSDACTAGSLARRRRISASRPSAASVRAG